MIDTFYLHIEFSGKNPWSINLPFICVKCGACCTLNDFLCAGKITTQPNERPEIHAKIQALFDKLGKMWETNEAQYDQHIQTTPCPFLANNGCTIYEIRPVGCRMFPKTAFGMQSTDCIALTRFKKEHAALTRGRSHVETYHFTGQESLKPVSFSDMQYRTCIVKLHKAGATVDELAFFEYMNGEK